MVVLQHHSVMKGFESSEYSATSGNFQSSGRAHGRFKTGSALNPTFI